MTADTIAASPGSDAEAAHERAVDLHRVDREPLQVAERRVAGAEVVDRELHAERAHAAITSMTASASSISTLSVISKHRLDGSHAGLRDHLGDAVGEIGLHELARREVDRDLERLADARAASAPRCAPPPRSPTSPICTIRPVSSAIGMNSAGRDQAALGVLPAHQRLGADAARVGEPDDRLEEEPELAALERAVHRVLGRVRGRRARVRIVSSNTSTRPRPSSLAWYIAASASRSNSSGRSSPDVANAMPTLAPTNISVPRTTIGRIDGREEPLGDLDRHARARCRSGRSSHRIVNSSPPNRATVSPGRITASSVRATATSSSSPASWPRLSLMFLKRSRSRNATPTLDFVRWQRAIA